MRCCLVNVVSSCAFTPPSDEGFETALWSFEKRKEKKSRKYEASVALQLQIETQGAIIQVNSAAHETRDDIPSDPRST